MSVIRKMIAVIVGVAGVALALYIGLWVLFIGGIEEIVNATNKTPVPSGPIVAAIFKIMFCELAAAVTIPTFGLAALIWPEERRLRLRRDARRGMSNREVERNWERIVRSDTTDTPKETP